MNELSNRLRESADFLIRQGYAKNDSAIARKLGMAYSTISMYLNGSRSPSWEMLFKFCENYPINIWWLRSGEGTMIKTDREAELLKKIDELERRIKELEG